MSGMRLDRHSRTACLKQSEFFSGQASGIHWPVVQPEAVLSLASFFLKQPGTDFLLPFFAVVGQFTTCAGLPTGSSPSASPPPIQSTKCLPVCSICTRTDMTCKKASIMNMVQPKRFHFISKSFKAVGRFAKWQWLQLLRTSYKSVALIYIYRVCVCLWAFSLCLLGCVCCLVLLFAVASLASSFLVGLARSGACAALRVARLSM
jgi:hypothetical protein